LADVCEIAVACESTDVREKAAACECEVSETVRVWLSVPGPTVLEEAGPGPSAVDDGCTIVFVFVVVGTIGAGALVEVGTSSSRLIDVEGGTAVSRLVEVDGGMASFRLVEVDDGGGGGGGGGRPSVDVAGPNLNAPCVPSSVVAVSSS
jgi:hypothetical protein